MKLAEQIRKFNELKTRIIDLVVALDELSSCNRDVNYSETLLNDDLSKQRSEMDKLQNTNIEIK